MSSTRYRRFIHLLLAVLVLLQVVDFATTLLGLQAGHAEKNKFILWLSNYTTLVGALLVAKSAALGGIYLMYRAWLDNPQLFGAPSVAIKFCLGIYLFVVFNNFQFI
jgi:hypothetical protein